MSPFWLFTASLGVLGASLVILASSYLVLTRGRRRNLRRAATTPPAKPFPRSMVRVLEDRSELEEAVRRAAEFERSTASALERRAVHYESLLETVGGRYRASRVEEVRPVVDLSLDHPNDESPDGSQPLTTKPG